MRYGPQDDYSRMVSLDSGAERDPSRRFIIDLDGLHLPPLTIPTFQSRESLLHQHPTHSSCGRLVGGSHRVGWMMSGCRASATAPMQPPASKSASPEHRDPGARRTDLLNSRPKEQRRSSGPPTRNPPQICVSVPSIPEDDLWEVGAYSCPFPWSRRLSAWLSSG